jgi:hypothetical protein
MKRASLALLLLLPALACNAGYGPREDHSKFVSAKLAGDGDTVLFSFHRYLYRRATGFRAFPDGGIPKYETDINILGTYNRRNRKLDILRRETNRDWQPGQGNYTIHDINGDIALIAQGGQVRGPFAHDLKHILVDLKTGKLTDLDLKGDLAARGRDLGYLYLADAHGTLIFVTPSLQQAQASNPQRQPGYVPEIWARTPAGDYLKVATSNHYERVRNGEVIYWMPDTRDFMAFSLSTRNTRVLPGYKTPPYAGDVSRGVNLAPDRKSIQYGVKLGGSWQYQPLPLDSKQLE